MATRKEPVDYTVTELREQLRCRNLSASGNKNELIIRLTEADPLVWDKMAAATVDLNPVEGICNGGEERIENGHRSSTNDAIVGNAIPDLVRRELELLRREKELLERELRLVTQGSSTRSNSSISVEAGPAARPAVNINTVSALLSEYQANGDSFENWRKQLEFVKRTYDLDDNMTKLLMSTKLKGRALQWFQSTPDNLEKPVLDVLNDMMTMFDHRPSRLTVRREFEMRSWRNNESFAEYFYDKVIMASRVPIDESEVVDYLIDGIPDPRVRDQARIQCFKTKAELFEAFKKISLRPPVERPRETRDVRWRERKEPIPQTLPRREERTVDHRELIRCYNCSEPGHLSKDCQRPRRPRGVCFRCGESGHRIENCPRERPRPNGAMHLLQQIGAVPPYELPLTYSVVDDRRCEGRYEISAIVDSGSPVSIIKDCHVPMSARSPASPGGYGLYGVNKSKLDVLGVFRSRVRIGSVDLEMVFLVVPIEAIAHAALLGRDFISSPLFKIVFSGNAMDLTPVASTSPAHNIDEEWRAISNINIVDEAVDASADLNVNPRVERAVTTELRKMFSELVITDANPAPIDFEMTITLKHDRPICFRPRRLAFSEREKLRGILDRLLETGVIRPSESEYASPIVLVRKKCGDMRLCVDFREINKVTVRDNFPTPLIDDLLDRLRGKRYFTKLDLKDGFHHVKVKESSIKYTSFVTPLGQFEYTRMPFGLTNAPRVFQRFTNKIFRSLIERNEVLIYLDDILIATEEIDEHLRILREVLRLAGRYRLQFRMDKCSFLYNDISYLGYSIDCDGIRPSGEHVESIVNYPTPRTVREIHQFVGLASYFRRFVPNFSRIAKPLYDVVKANKFSFGPLENEAFDALRERLASQPVLAIYSPKLPTELHCDASANGFGGILLQRQPNGKLQPISYFSRRTTPVESKYHSFELECLAVIYAIKRFHIYLAGLHFKILTDCDSFRLTLSKQDVNPRISRWAMFLQSYDYEIQHRSGSQMKHVDALSRCHNVLVLEANTFEQTMALKQGQDSEICTLREKLETAEEKFFELRNGLVYRKQTRDKLLFYVPQIMEHNVIRTCHDDVGHVGVDKVIENLTRTYWFPKMRDKVKAYISNCLKCIEFSPIEGKAQGYLHSIPKGVLPFETIHIDHYGPLDRSRRRNRYVLSVVDGFTKYVRLYPCKTVKSEETIKHLRHYFRAYGRPRRLISDRGTAFTSGVFGAFVNNEQVDHVLIAVGTPRANGQVERFNRVITPMIAKLSPSSDKWDEVLEKVEFAINNTVCRSTGQTPSKLLFGVNQKGDVCDNVRSFLEQESHEERDLSRVREGAAEAIQKNQRVNERYYNNRRKEATSYEVGDYVMIRNVDTTPGTSKKLIPKFKGPYIVKEVLDRDRYVVTDVEGFQITQRPFRGVVGPDQMKFWIREVSR